MTGLNGVTHLTLRRHSDMELDPPDNNGADIPMDFDFGPEVPFDSAPEEMNPRSESVLPITPRKRKVRHFGHFMGYSH